MKRVWKQAHAIQAVTLVLLVALSLASVVFTLRVSAQRAESSVTMPDSTSTAYDSSVHVLNTELEETLQPTDSAELTPEAPTPDPAPDPGVQLPMIMYALPPTPTPTPAPAPPTGDGQSFRLKINPPSADANFRTGEVSLWIPSTTEPLRGVIIYGPGCGASSLGNKPGRDRAAFAQKWRLGFVGMYFTDNGRFCSWSKGREAGQAVLAALNHFAQESGRPELRNAPWVMYGMSGGAGFSMEMAFAYPERTIAVFPRGHVSGSKQAPVAYNIPMMLSIGETDSGTRGMKNLFQTHRAQGAIWSYAETPREGHVLGQSWTMALIFFDAVLAQRLPETPPTNGPVPLKPVDSSRAWLGNISNYSVAQENAYTGNKLEAAWLPDERTARKWREFVTTAKVSQ